ncbi:MAG: YkgJ family cysteine cluster protein [Myxococcota bacterium]
MTHPLGRPWGPAALTCAGCTWFASGTCRAARPYGDPEPSVPADTRACDLFEVLDSCDPCGACCREAFDAVPSDGGDLPASHVVQWDPEFTMVRRVPQGRGTRCLCLYGDGVNHPFRCTHYAVRPTACRELERGEENCLLARRAVGLSVDPHRSR